MLSIILKIKYAIIYPIDCGGDLSSTEQESNTLNLDLLLFRLTVLNNNKGNQNRYKLQLNSDPSQNVFWRTTQGQGIGTQEKQLIQNSPRWHTPTSEKRKNRKENSESRKNSSQTAEIKTTSQWSRKKYQEPPSKRNEEYIHLKIEE